VSQLIDTEFFAVEVVLGERQARELIPVCRRLGATGILTYPISCIVH
jgi:ATP phosphoribosyltransferase